MADLPPVTNTAAPGILMEAYPISLYYENDDDCFVAELNAFNDAQVHGSTWAQAAAAAKIAHRLLVEAYRAAGYTLPTV